MLTQRLEVEASKGRADVQISLAKSSIGINIAEDDASAVKTRERGLPVAAGLEALQAAIGKDQAAIVNAVNALAEGAQRFMPENLALTVGGEGGLGASLSALVPLLMGNLQDHAEPAAPAPAHPHSDGETAPVAVQPAPLSHPPLSCRLG